MVPGVNPVIALVKLPEPVPSEVLSSAVVGSLLLLQQTPRVVTEDPPSFVIFPPLVTVVAVIADKSVVVKMGAKAKVVNVVVWLL